MTAFKLILSGLRYFWRTNLGVLLGAAVATTVLVGALVVGDSVDHTLRNIALQRIGDVHLAMITQDRFFRAALADEIGKETNAPTAAVVFVNGRARLDEQGKPWVNGVQVLGVDERFFKLGTHDAVFADVPSDGVVLNAHLAERLGVEVGDELRLRVEKPSALPRDAALSSDSILSPSKPVKVTGIVTDDQFGRFALAANQTAPLNLYLPRRSLIDMAEIGEGEDRANLLLVGGRVGDKPDPTIPEAAAALGRYWQLTDLQLELRKLKTVDYYELRSGRVFFDPPLTEAAKRVDPDVLLSLSYLVNMAQRADGNSPQVPYFVATGLSDTSVLPGREGKPLDDNEIAINDWMAQQENLNAAAGDRIDLHYFVARRGRVLDEVNRQFTVAQVVPMKGMAADRQLAPQFPDAPDTEDETDLSDWKPSFRQAYKIRPIDDEYWDHYRATPKAFVSLKAGQSMWANRFGNLTSARFATSEHDFDALEAALRKEIDPGAVGFLFTDVRTPALKASDNALDFGQLFLGFSFFLIVAALLLMGMLFAFGVEQRTGEVGTLLALGYTKPRVRRLLLMEGAILAAIGVAIGVAGGLLYTRGVLAFMADVWSSLPGASSIVFHATPMSLGIGAGASFVVAMLTIWLFVWRESRRTARELLATGVGISGSGAVSRVVHGWRRHIGWWIGAVCLLGALGIMAGTGFSGGREAAGAFFGAGTLVLLGAFGVFDAMLVRFAATTESADQAAAVAHRMTVGRMGLRGSGRRRGRSIATVSLLAFGCFMVVGTHAFTKDAEVGAADKSSGTGGYAFYAEQSIPILYDLNTAEGREKLDVDRITTEDGRQVDVDWSGAHVTAVRVREGDEASCLNLNQAQTPHLFGIDPAKLDGRFTITSTIPDLSTDDGWQVLDATLDDGAIPAVADQGSLQWALKGDVGMTLEYKDDNGNPVKVRIVAAIASSIFQGRLIISEDNFEKLFPDESGYRVLLVDAPEEQSRRDAIAEGLAFGLGDYGIQLTTAADRLAQFNAVENTYLAIFQLLGFLGLLLGSIGLGIVVARNILERRGELGLMRAVGFSHPSVYWLILSEHWLLLLFGVASGVVAAILSVAPAMLEPGRHVPYTLMITTLFGVLVSGILWVLLATWAALRGNLIEALRAE